MLIEIIMLIVALYICSLIQRSRQPKNISTQTEESDESSIIPESVETETKPSLADTSALTASVTLYAPTVSIATTTQERPKIHARITQESAKIDVTPAWFNPVSIPNSNQIPLSRTYDTNSTADCSTVKCLSSYRSMTKEKPIDFVKYPFRGTIDDTETLVVVLDQLVNQLGIGLSFTEDQFNYDISDYRAACGIADLGNIHSVMSSENGIQTAKFQFRFNLSYQSVTKSVSTLKDFVLRFIYAIANIIGCKPQFIRVFGVENSLMQSDNLSVSFGITTPSEIKTEELAKQLQEKMTTQYTRELNAATDILRHVVPGRYKYKLEPVLVHLQLQKSDFEPKYNRDYSQPHPDEARRGDRSYYLPIPWYRHALKVQDKYSQDKVWLGMNNSPGEWAVAYHGTGYQSAKSIAGQGFLQSKVTRDVFKQDAINKIGSKADVKGIYLATHCEKGASLYAIPFEVKNSDGKTTRYFMAFQCRVEPDKYTEHTDNSVVKVGKALRVFDEKAIRPYGILLKEEKISKSDSDCILS